MPKVEIERAFQMVSEIAPKRRRFAIPRRAQMRTEGVRASGAGAREAHFGAFRKVAALVRSGGLLAISLRSGPSPAGSEMHPVSLEEIEHLARNCGFAVEKVQHAADQQGRVDVSWTSVALRLPDDGTGALPLLRHVILNDQKSATYKLGLLRALCRAADGSAGMVQDTGDEFLRVPLGLVALNWLRLYLPLIRESLPQTPTNVDAQGLGFAKEGFQTLLSGVSASDLRIGARFTLDRAQALHAALRDAAQTIDRMPSTFMTYPMGGRILPVERGRLRGPPSIVELDTDYLTAFGWIRVPGHLWRAMRRNAAWIEPTLIAEWMRLMREYARGQNRPLADTKMFAAMRWSDPARDVSRAREVAAHCSGGWQSTLYLDRPTPEPQHLGHRPYVPLDGMAVQRSLEPAACPSRG